MLDGAQTPVPSCVVAQQLLWHWSFAVQMSWHASSSETQTDVLLWKPQQSAFFAHGPPAFEHCPAPPEPPAPGPEHADAAKHTEIPAEPSTQQLVLQSEALLQVAWHVPSSLTHWAKPAVNPQQSAFLVHDSPSAAQTFVPLPPWAEVPPPPPAPLGALGESPLLEPHPTAMNSETTPKHHARSIFMRHYLLVSREGSATHVPGAKNAGLRVLAKSDCIARGDGRIVSFLRPDRASHPPRTRP
jgi:hypothetical protein